MIDYFKQNPVPLAPQTNITEVRRAIKGYARAFKINIMNDRDPLIQLQETREEIGRFFKRLKVEMGGLNIRKHWRLNFINKSRAPNHINMRKDTVIESDIVS